MSITGAAVSERKIQGCYSIKYRDPMDHSWQFSMDYGWCSDPITQKRRWTCAESPRGFINWTLLTDVPDHGYRALLDHFGLKECDISFQEIISNNPSPADIMLIRRRKEDRDNLARKIVKNMRLGCPENEVADTFE